MAFKVCQCAQDNPIGVCRSMVYKYHWVRLLRYSLLYTLFWPVARRPKLKWHWICSVVQGFWCLHTLQCLLVYLPMLAWVCGSYMLLKVLPCFFTGCVIKLQPCWHLQTLSMLIHNLHCLDLAIQKVLASCCLPSSLSLILPVTWSWRSQQSTTSDVVSIVCSELLVRHSIWQVVDMSNDQPYDHL